MHLHCSSTKRPTRFLCSSHVYYPTEDFLYYSGHIFCLRTRGGRSLSVRFNLTGLLKTARTNYCSWYSTIKEQQHWPIRLPSSTAQLQPRTEKEWGPDIISAGLDNIASAPTIRWPITPSVFNQSTHFSFFYNHPPRSTLPVVESGLRRQWRAE